MSSSDDVALALAAFVLMCKRKPRKKKREVWCKDWLMKRKTYSHINLLRELKIFPRDWHNYLRRNEETYLNLLSLVTPLIKKQVTIMREAVTLLHHTRDYQQHCYFFRPEGVGHIDLICTTARVMKYFNIFLFCRMASLRYYVVWLL
jgi:hypothetical protein